MLARRTAALCPHSPRTYSLVVTAGLSDSLIFRVTQAHSFRFYHLQFCLRSFRDTTHPCHSRAFSDGSESQLGGPLTATAPPSSRLKHNGAGGLWFATSNTALVVFAEDRYQVPSPFSSNASLASEAPTEEVPDFVRPFAIPEVAPEPPQGNGYGSFLPEDAIPDLQTVLASCGQRMISLR